MTTARNIVYSYADKRQFDEVELDLTGALPVNKGDIITRRGKTWRVDSVHLIAEDIRAIPALWVLLIEALVN